MSRRPFLHIPIRGPRNGTPAEGIYLRLWQDYITQPPSADLHCEPWTTKLDLVLRDVPGPTTQRHARVAASFMVWMGTPAGRGFTWSCLRAPGDEQHFLRQWATENQRSFGVNHNMRTIECMLSPNFPDSPFKAATITLDDIDVVEGMVRWWASAEAHAIRNVAAPLIDAARDEILGRMMRQLQ